MQSLHDPDPWAIPFDPPDSHYDPPKVTRPAGEDLDATLWALTLELGYRPRELTRPEMDALMREAVALYLTGLRHPGWMQRYVVLRAGALAPGRAGA